MLQRIQPTISGGQHCQCAVVICLSRDKITEIKGHTCKCQIALTLLLWIFHRALNALNQQLLRLCKMLQTQSLQRPHIVNLIAIGDILVVAKHFLQILLYDRNILHVNIKILCAFDLCRERDIVIVRMQL